MHTVEKEPGDQIIQGLKEALAYQAGDTKGSRTHVFQVPCFCPHNCQAGKCKKATAGALFDDTSLDEKPGI